MNTEQARLARDAFRNTARSVPSGLNFGRSLLLTLSPARSTGRSSSRGKTTSRAPDGSSATRQAGRAAIEALSPPHHALRVGSAKENDGGEGGIRTHVPVLPDHPISSRRRYDRFGTSPADSTAILALCYERNRDQARRVAASIAPVGVCLDARRPQLSSRRRWPPRRMLAALLHNRQTRAAADPRPRRTAGGHPQPARPATTSAPRGPQGFEYRLAQLHSRAS